MSIANHDDFKIGTGDFLMAAVAKIVTGNGPININVTNASRRSKRT